MPTKLEDIDLSWESVGPIYRAMEPIYKAFQWHGPPFQMLVQELKIFGRPLGEITLLEFAEISRLAGVRYCEYRLRIEALMNEDLPLVVPVPKQ